MLEVLESKENQIMKIKEKEQEMENKYETAMNANLESKHKQLDMVNEEEDEEKYQKILSDIQSFNKYEEEIKEADRLENEHNNKVLLDVYQY